MFGVDVIIVMTTRTGISDRGYLSMENTNRNSVFPCVAMCFSLVSVSVKKNMCVNICAFCKPISLFFHVSPSVRKMCVLQSRGFFPPNRALANRRTWKKKANI